MENADIVVKVNVSKYTSMDYDKALPLIQQGKDAAVSEAQVLLPYALNQADWDAYVAQRDARKLGPAPTPQFVKVEGETPDANKKIETFLKPLAGKPIDTPRLGTDLTRLTGMGTLDSVSYGLTTERNEVGLLVTTHDKNYAPPLLQLGFAVDGSQPNDVTFTLAGRLTFIGIAGAGSELRNDIQFGNIYGINSQLYKPFTSTSRWFYAPNISASSTQAKIYSRGNRVAEYSFGKAASGLDLGYATSRFSEVRGGYEVGYLNAYLKLGIPEFSSVSGRVGFTDFLFNTEHLDDPIIPRKGYLGRLDFNWVDTSPGATTAFPRVQATTSFFKSVSRPASVFLIADGGSTVGYRNTGVPQYLMGGTTGWIAYGPNELRGNQFYLFRTGYLHRLLRCHRSLATTYTASRCSRSEKCSGHPA